MQDKHIYEYAIIRYVPFVERGERINVGVIVFSKFAKFLQVKVNLDESKIQCIAPDADIESLRDYLNAWDNICKGEGGGPIGDLEIHVRFRWLTASRSTIIQCSRVHPGLSQNLDATLVDLFNKYVI